MLAQTQIIRSGRALTVTVLISVLFCSLVLQLLLARIPGHPSDMPLNMTWLRSAVTYGIATSFQKQVEVDVELPNHGPVEITLYAIAGHAYRLFISPSLSIVQPWLAIFTKLPSILTIVATGMIIFWLTRINHTLNDALLWITLILFHPAIIFVSALWGQTDVIYSTLLMLSIGCTITSRFHGAGIACALAMLHKPNALIFLPAIIILHAKDIRTATRFTTGLIAVFLITHLYFYLAGSSWTYADLFLHSNDRAGTDPGNALNLWRIVFGSNIPYHVPIRDCFSYASCYTIGWSSVAILSLPFLFILWKLRRTAREQTGMIFGCVSSLSLITFLFGTGMHERYLFPYLLLAIPFAQRGWLQATAYWSISALYLINLMDHWRPVPWFDFMWSTTIADTSARLLVVFGLMHMTLVLRDAWKEWRSPKNSLSKKSASQKVMQ